MYARKFMIILTVGFIGTILIYNLPHQPKLIGKYFQLGSLKRPGFKTILFWTKWFTRNSVEKYVHINFDGCPVDKCEMTEDRSRLEESDAVFFHMWPSDFEPLPKNRRPDQRYIMMTFESPHGPGVDRKIFKKIPHHFFNWTATYRLDSELFGKLFYSWNFPPKHNVSQSARPEIDNYYGINITSKTKPVVWIASNCKTKINREGYIQELQKHILVDVYGKCLSKPKSCPRHDRVKCDAMLQRDYFFYLSFENSLCPDYVTEKLFRAYETGTVPIVFGGANYSLFAPPHSYIDARDFKTPKLLAEYLLKLTKDKNLYSRYFDWRGHYDMETREMQLKKNSCILCQMLHDPTLPATSYDDIEKWWFDKPSCENFRWVKSD